MPMQSSLRKRWTANCSTTFKWLFWIIGFYALLCIFLPMQVRAEESSQTVELNGTADLLLLHEENLSEDELDSVRILSDSATALGKSAEIGTPEKAEGLYGRYSMILCYKMNHHTELAGELSQSGAKIMVLGGDLLPDLLSAQKAEWRGEKSVFRYAFSDQNQYEALVDMPEFFYRLDSVYENGTLEEEETSVPFCSRNGNVWYVPLDALGDTLIRAALLREISIALWDYAGLPPKRGQYFVLDQVYPYMPTEELLKRVELLIQEKLPFVISVMPIYQNADYPAMQQFCEVLRYAQANGGAVILHAPILRSRVTDLDELNGQLTTAVTNLTNWGVYPLGIDVPYSWTWDETMLAWMKRSRTAFVYQDTEKPAFTRDTVMNLLYYNYHHLVLPALSLDDGSANCVQQYSAAQRVSAAIPMEELEARIAAAENNGNAYYSLWDSEQSLWADNFHLSWKNQALTINDEVCSLTYEPQSYPEDYDYKRNILQRFTMNIQNESQGLIILVTAVTILFLLMIGYARWRQHRHFLLELGQKHQKKQNRKRRKGEDESCH